MIPALVEMASILSETIHRTAGVQLHIERLWLFDSLF